MTDEYMLTRRLIDGWLGRQKLQIQGPHQTPRINTYAKRTRAQHTKLPGLMKEEILTAALLAWQRIGKWGVLTTSIIVVTKCTTKATPKGIILPHHSTALSFTTGKSQQHQLEEVTGLITSAVNPCAQFRSTFLFSLVLPPIKCYCHQRQSKFPGLK